MRVVKYFFEKTDKKYKKIIVWIMCSLLTLNPFYYIMELML